MAGEKAIVGILGDYRGFFADLMARVSAAGIEVPARELSHLAFRTATVEEYVSVRGRLRACCSAEVENVWNGRTIGKFLLARPLALGDGHSVSLIELIPPPHRQPFPMGLEHAGIVIGAEFDAFCRKHDAIFTGRQDQGPYCQPAFITFENQRSVKFYRHSLREVVEKEGRRFLPPPDATDRTDDGKDAGTDVGTNAGTNDRSRDRSPE